MAKFFRAWLKWAASLVAVAVAVLLIMAGVAVFLTWSWQPALNFIPRLDGAALRLMLLFVVIMSGLGAAARW